MEKKKQAFLVARMKEGKREVIQTFFEKGGVSAQDRALEFTETQPKRDLEELGHSPYQYVIYDLGEF